MNKQLITEIVIKELPDGHEDKLLTPDDLFIKYWITGRSGDVMRLTKQGYNAFVAAGLQEYSYNIYLRSLSHKLNNIKVNQLTLLMGKLLECPWYLTIAVEPNEEGKSFSLKIFDSKVAMMINLYGSVEDYLTRDK